MNKNAFGIDVLNRPFLAPRDRAQSLVPKAGTKDIFYSNLRATGNYSIEEGEGLMCELTVEYKGLLNGAIPDPILVYGNVTKATSLEHTSGNESRTYNVSYVSDSLTTNYITNTRNQTFPKSDLPFGFQYLILQSIYTVTSGSDSRKGNTYAGNPPVSVSITLDSITRNQVPGTPYWECSQTQSYTLQ